MTDLLFHQGFYYEAGGFEVGDLVVTTKYFNSISRNTPYEIAEISPGNFKHYDYSSNPKGISVYCQKLKLSVSHGYTNAFNASNFKLYQKGKNNMMKTSLAIAVDKPCIIFKLNEEVVDGTVVSTRVGDPTFVESYTAAQALTMKMIQSTIRESNVYDKYAIFEQKSIAQAKEPPVVFEDD